MSNSMLEQSKLELDPVELEPKDFNLILENLDKGVPSAHDDGKKYFPRFDGSRWICDGPDGPCQHFRIYRTPCRHILQKRFENLNDLYKQISEKVEYSRDIRDMHCDEFEDVITYVSCYKQYEINKLSTIFLNIAILRGQVSVDDLHIATNEHYADNPIVGVAIGSMKRSGYIECIGYRKTERKIAHGRPVGIYKITKKGFEMLRKSRMEAPII